MIEFTKKSVPLTRFTSPRYYNAHHPSRYAPYALLLGCLSKTTLEAGKVRYSRSPKALAIGLQTYLSRRSASRQLERLREIIPQRKDTNAQQDDPMDDEDGSRLPRCPNWELQDEDGFDIDMGSSHSAAPVHYDYRVDLEDEEERDCILPSYTPFPPALQYPDGDGFDIDMGSSHSAAPVYHDYRVDLEDEEERDCILPLYTSFPPALQYPEGYVCESDDDILIHSLDHSEPVMDYLIDSVDILSLPALSLAKPAHIQRVTVGVGLLSLDAPSSESGTVAKGGSSDFYAAFCDTFEKENIESISMEIDLNHIDEDIDMLPAKEDFPRAFKREQTPSPLQGQTPFPSEPTTPMECPPTPPFEPLYSPQQPLSLPHLFFVKLAQVESEAIASGAVPIQEEDYEMCESTSTGFQDNASLPHDMVEITKDNDSRPFGELVLPDLEVEAEANVEVQVAPDVIVAIESEDGPGPSIPTEALSVTPVQFAIGESAKPLIHSLDFHLVPASGDACHPIFREDAEPEPILSAEEIDAMFIHVAAEVELDSPTPNIPAQLIEVAEFIRMVEEGVTDLIDFAEDVYVEAPAAATENPSVSDKEYEDATILEGEVDLICFGKDASPAHNIARRVLDDPADVKGNLYGDRWALEDLVDLAGQDDSTGDSSPEEDSIEDNLEELKLEETVKVVGVDKIPQEKSFEESQEPAKEAPRTKPQHKYYAPPKPNALPQQRATLKKSKHERRQREAAGITEEKKYYSSYRSREKDAHQNTCPRNANETEKQTPKRTTGRRYPTEDKDGVNFRRFKTKGTTYSSPEEEKEEQEEADPIFPGDFLASERKQASSDSLPGWFSFNFFSWFRT